MLSRVCPLSFCLSVSVARLLERIRVLVVVSVVVCSVVDFRRGTHAGKECNTSRHIGTGITTAADGKPSRYTDAL